MRDPAPTDASTVMSPDWLTSALAPFADGARVESVALIETRVTVATKLRLALTWNRESANLPRDVCVKGLLGPEAAPFVGSGVAETEARFYEVLAPGITGLRTASCLYAGVDAGTRHGVIVMRDMVAQGSGFLDPLSPCDETTAAATLEQLALLHAHRTKPGPVAPWEASKLDFFIERSPVTPAMLQDLLEGERAEGLPAALRSGVRVHGALRGLKTALAGTPPCIIHGDSHAGNIVLTPDGPGLIDWQLLQTGHWALDVAYHIPAVLTVEERRRHERALLDHYLECLARQGVTPPDREVAWRDYRAALVYGYYLWGITRRVEPTVIRTFVQRLGAAVSDHGALALASGT